MIITASDAERVLPAFLDSIIGQTLQDVEIICVDTGSTDRTWEILGEYEIKEPRLRRIQNNDRNKGAARNLGMESAEGKYLFFADTDCRFDPEMLHDAVACAETDQADVVVFDGREYDQKSRAFTQTGAFLQTTLLPDKRPFRCSDIPDRTLRFTGCSTWNKLFRSEFIRKEGLSFRAPENTEDVFFVFMAMILAQRISCVDKPYVSYRSSEWAAAPSSDERSLFSFAECILEIHKNLVSRGLLEKTEHAFIDKAIEMCSEALKKAEGQENRVRICRRLNENDFLALKLTDHPLDYYADKKDYYLVKGSRYAVELDEHFCRKERTAPRILKQAEGSAAPLVTVIVPVYNVEQYLRACLDSLVDQTLSDIEILCVNDGSTDRSPDILTEYAEKDGRVTVYTQENSGLSHTRNVGIKAARGQYICFVDSDDCLDTSALEILYHRAAADRLDILLFGAKTLADPPDNKALAETAGKFNYLRNYDYEGVFSGPDLASLLKRNNDYYESACLQLVRRQFCLDKGLSFCEGLTHEDIYYTFQALLSAERAGCENKTFYVRRIRQGSIMTGGMTFYNVYGYFRSFVQMSRFYERKLIEHPEWSEDPYIPMIVRGIGQGFKWRYGKLSPEERQFELGLPDNELEMLRFLVSDYMEMLETKQQIERIKNSLGFRIGRIQTWPIRKIRDMIKRPERR